MTLTFEHLGTFWPHGGDLFYMVSRKGDETARVYVDSLGETWVDIRRIPEGGTFHTERVTAYRAFGGSVGAEAILRGLGFGLKRSARYAHRVVERDA